jgi:2-polyprenyl-3-methyl-5-hydroxy-6-metoxy-1,4-benzoquinol methylase
MSANSEHITKLSPERADQEQMAGHLMESEHRGRYLWSAQLAEGREVLDAGCGTGYGTEILAAAGAQRAVGVDISQDAIEAARSYSSEDVSEFSLGSLHELPFEDGAFDLAVCFEAIEHVENQQLAIGELRRVLGPTGVLAISSPNRNVYPPGNPHHTHEYVPDELERALADEFTNVRLYRQSSWLGAAVLDDNQSRAIGVEAELMLRVIKIASVEPGDEVFTVALASDAELPTPDALALIGKPFEIRWWEDRLDEAISERDNERVERTREQAERDREQAERDRERKELGSVLLAVETDLANAQNQIEQLRATDAEVKEWATEQGELARSSEHGRLDFENRLHRAERTIDDITESVSWRITSPLRGLKRLSRGR